LCPRRISGYLAEAFQKKSKRVSYCVHKTSRLHTARGGVFPSQGADCGYEKKAIVGVMGSVAEMELLSL